MKTIFNFLSVFLVGLMTVAGIYAQPSSLPKGGVIPHNGNKVELMKSENGKFILALETSHANGYTTVFIWDVTNKKNVYENEWQGGADKLTVQNDGNVVIIDNTGRVFWETKTTGWSNPSLKLMNEGNLVVLSGTQEKWSSHTPEKKANDPNNKGDRLQTTNILSVENYLTSANEQYHLKVYDSGNVTLLDRNGTVYWSSNTGHLGNNFDAMKFQSDGNLVIYNKNGTAVWAINCQNKGGTMLILQDDGDLVIKKQDGTAIWSLKRWKVDYPPSGSKGSSCN